MQLKQRAELARLRKKFRHDVEVYKTDLAGESDYNILKILAVLELDHNVTSSIHTIFDTLSEDQEAYGMVSVVLAKSIIGLARIAKENDSGYTKNTLHKCLVLLTNELKELP